MSAAKRLAGKRAVVTGAASGLGRDISIALARKGWKILVADINDSGADETLEMVKQAGGSGEVMHCDVTKIEDIQKMADHCFDGWGGVDLLVNNAGVAVAGIVGDIPIKNWEWIVDINFWGMLYGCHVFIPKMKAQGSGHIVNVASAAGIASLPEMAPYNATKAAIISLSETLKSELAADNIGVTVVCPTFFKANLDQSMRYTDEFQIEFASASFEKSRMSSERVARKVVRAVEKNKFYLLPQLSAKFVWVMKRLSPPMFYRFLAFFMRIGLGKRLALILARLGMT